MHDGNPRAKCSRVHCVFLPHMFPQGAKNVRFYCHDSTLWFMSVSRLQATSDYLLKLSPELARLVFKAKTRMFDIKSNYKRKYRSVLTCPFCMVQDETFDYLFACPHGIVVPNILQGVTFNSYFLLQTLILLRVLESFCKDISSIVRFLCRLLATLKVIFLYN